MRKINFTKMVASGNDFIITESQDSRNLVRRICDRKYGIGADGLLLLEKSKTADVKMRLFNPDGSEAEMCGNGARCIALYIDKKKVYIETKAGVIESEVKGNNVRIKLTEPKDIKLDIPIKINSRIIKVNSVDTGVPHTVIFVEGLEKIDIIPLARFIRYHKKFSPRGTNVDFVEILGKDSIKIRTYERGVEDETLACGTGVVASAIIFTLKWNILKKIKVYTKEDVLKVYFNRNGDKFMDVWLEGKAKIVYKGVYNV